MGCQKTAAHLRCVCKFYAKRQSYSRTPRTFSTAIVFSNDVFPISRKWESQIASAIILVGNKGNDTGTKQTEGMNLARP